MLELIAVVLTFVAVTAFVLLLVSSPSHVAEARVSNLGRTRPEQRDSMGKVLRTDSGTFPVLRGLTSGSWAERARLDLDQAGTALKVSEYLLIRLLVATCAAGVAFVLLVDSSLVLVAAIIAGLVGFMLPAWFFAWRRSHRIDAINEALPEALSLISNSLRSGFAFTQAVELATKQMKEPLSQEFNQYLHDMSLGASPEDSLEGLARRTGSYDIEMMVSTILVQRTTGGNLSEILDNVRDTIKERQRLNAEIRALTASQRLTGLILSIYPILLGALLAALAPSVWSVLWTTETGRVFLGVAIVLQIMGIITIRRILRLEV